MQLGSISTLQIHKGVTDLYLEDYYEIVKGPISPKTDVRLQEIKAGIDAGIKEMDLASENRAAGKITEEEYDAIMLRNDKISNKQEAYEKLLERVNKLKETASQQGITTWVFDDTGYDRLLGNSADKKQNRNALLLLFIMVVLVGCVFVYEKQNNTLYLIRSTKRGRRYLYHKKIAASILLMTVAYAIVIFVELYNTQHLYGYEALAAPIQSIACFSNFRIHCSILVFLVTIYLSKLILLWIIVYICSLISIITNKEEHTLLVGCIVLLLPAILYYIGLSWAGYISVIKPVALVEVVRTGKTVWIIGIPISIVVLLGIVSRNLGIRVWSNKLGELH